MSTNLFNPSSWILLFFLIIGQFACTTETAQTSDDPPVKLSEKIQGNWLVTGAERGGKTTGMLDGAFLKFNSNNKMSTNLTGAEVQYDYELKDKVIQQKGNTEIFYNVEAIQDTTMTVTFIMMGTQFKLDLTRS